MVPHADGEGTPTDQVNTPLSHSDGARQDYLCLLLSDKAPSYVDFLTLVYGRSFSAENIKILLGHVRATTLKQYQSVWKRWITFLRNSNPTCISQDVVLSFFRYLFQDLGFQSTTLATYKSALKLPLEKGFNVDLSGDVFSMVTRSFALQRPLEPPRRLSWCLGKVLDHLAALPTGSLNPRTLLNKCIFLLGLASGGRVSELAALSRNPDLLVFLPSGSLEVRTDPSFLAKNEIPTKRWRPWCIPALEDANKSLCPVAALKSYLQETTAFKSGPLFRCHTSGKPMSSAQIRAAMTSLIKLSNPDSIPKMHDIRKMASSYAFFNDMSIEDMSRSTGWSSSRVFLRHYLKEVEDLRHACVSLGSIVSPRIAPH